jgi:hypothetical protein
MASGPVDAEYRGCIHPWFLRPENSTSGFLMSWDTCRPQ